jgi:hypothetical protein
MFLDDLPKAQKRPYPKYSARMSYEAYIKYVALLLVMMNMNLIRFEVVDPDPHLTQNQNLTLTRCQIKSLHLSHNENRAKFSLTLQFLWEISLFYYFCKPSSVTVINSTFRIINNHLHMIYWEFLK